MLLQEADRAVGEARARVGAIRGGVVRRSGVVDDVRLEGVHPCGEGVASFAHVPGAVAGRREHAGQESGGVVGLRPGRLGAGDALPGSSGQHHRAARGADRADHRALRVGAGEGEAAGDERIEVRSEESRRAERAQAVGPMVVGVDVEDVRPGRRELRGEAG